MSRHHHGVLWRATRAARRRERCPDAFPPPGFERDVTEAVKKASAWYLYLFLILPVVLAIPPMIVSRVFGWDARHLSSAELVALIVGTYAGLGLLALGALFLWAGVEDWRTEHRTHVGKTSPRSYGDNQRPV